MKDRMIDLPTLILTLIGAVGSYYEACKPFYTRKSISEVIVGVLEKLKLDNYLLESKILDEIISNPARPLIKILSYQLGLEIKRKYGCFSEDEIEEKLSEILYKKLLRNERLNKE
jgi:hypothetical protein